MRRGAPCASALNTNYLPDKSKFVRIYNGRPMVAPTMFVRTLCAKLGFIGVFIKLVCLCEELPHRLGRSSLSKGALN